MTVVKICGLTRPDDARVAVEAGAELVGMILWAPSPRAAALDAARRVREAVGDEAEVVGVFVDELPERVDELVAELRLDRVQLHGAEPAEEVLRHGDRVLRGVRDGDASAVPAGVPVVYDGPFGGRPGPEELEGHWRAARALGAERPVLLAGGLDPDNVAAAVRAAAPWGVDVARGVEASHGIKDHDRLRRFVAAAKEALP